MKQLENFVATSAERMPNVGMEEIVRNLSFISGYDGLTFAIEPFTADHARELSNQTNRN